MGRFGTWIIGVSDYSVAGGMLLTALVILGVLCKVVLIDPSREQVLELYRTSSGDERFWVREIHQVKGENSILEATVSVRFLREGEPRIREELEKLDLDYYILGIVDKE